MNTEPTTCLNTDKELWRKNPDYYSPSIHVTKEGNIGINVAGRVIVAPIEMWHQCGKELLCPNVPTWLMKIARWILNYNTKLNKLNKKN